MLLSCVTQVCDSLYLVNWCIAGSLAGARPLLGRGRGRLPCTRRATTSAGRLSSTRTGSCLLAIASMGTGVESGSFLSPEKLRHTIIIAIINLSTLLDQKRLSLSFVFAQSIDGIVGL